MRIIVGITGASGVIYGIRLLQVLHDLQIETHLVISSSGAITLAYETGWRIEDVRALATEVHDNADIAAKIGSGSFNREAMVIIPCSMKTLSAIAHSYNENLIAHCGDATLKERKKLILVVRETPLNLGHLRNMVLATENGGIILPPMPAFYTRPTTVEDIVNHTVGKVLDVLNIEHGIYPKWEGLK
jgi:flavin prenyltransferase